MLGGTFSMSFVAAAMFIIIGGLLIFFDGRVLCIVCNNLIFTIFGVISLIFGVLGVIGNLGSRAAPGN